jgi:hypothetical protein
MARNKISKVRQYSFMAQNLETREQGTMFIAAKNLDEAQAHRWHMHSDPGNPIECSGYVGPMSGSTWVTPDAIRGFVTSDVLHAEHLATLPVVEHDPALLAEYIALHGNPPERGARLTHNMLNPNGRVIAVAHGTPSYCDPSSEAYHCM